MRENSLSESNPAVEQDVQRIQELENSATPSAQAYVDLGNLYARQSKFPQAIKSYRQAIALKQDFALAHRELAAVFRQSGRNGLAADHQYKTFKLEPDTVTVQQYYELGQTLQVQNKPARAIACFQEAILSQPDFLSAYQAWAKILSQQGKQKREIAVYRLGIKNNPQDSRYYYALALVFAEQNKLTRANNNFRQAAQLKPSADIYYHWGLIQHELQAYARASSLLQQAAELEPSADIYYHWGLTLAKLKEYDRAQSCYQQAVSLKPDYALAFYQLGVLWQDRQQWHQAIAAYRQAVSLNPDLEQSLLNMGIVYRQLKKYDLSIACYHELIKRFDQTSPLEATTFAEYHQTLAEHPKISARLYYQLGKLLRARGRFGEAVTAYCQAIELNPQFKLPYIDLQYIPIAQEESTELIQFYRRILGQNPQITIAWGNLGDVLTQQDCLTEAIDCYRKGSYQKSVQLYPSLAEYDWQPAKKSGPDFIIAGASKCGTSSIYHYLSHHPQILLPHKKEIDFYWQNYQRGIDWYLAHFPTITDRPDFLTGEATPNYLRFPQVAKRIKHTFPQTKIIILLRNPIDRAISWHYHKLNTGLTKVDLATAIATEIERLADVSETEIANTGFYDPDNIMSSLYLYKIKPWMEILGREQFLILKSEDFYLNPLENMQQVFQFLNLPNCALDNYPKVNAGSYDRVDSQLRKTLSDYFAPYNRQLEEYLDLKFDWS